jgi:sugar phosphate isomerase/epimerase
VQVAAAGIGVEVWSQRGRDEPQLHGDAVARVRAACRAAPFATLHSSYEHWHWDPAGLRAQIDLAAAIGAEGVVLHVGGLGLADRSATLDTPTVRRIAGHAAERDVRLLLENTADGAWALDRVLDAFGDDPERSNLGICIDIGHAHISTDLPGDPVLAYLERYRQPLRHLHLHDNDRLADDHRAPGRGTVDWDALSAWIASNRVAVPAVLELHTEVDPMEAIREALGKLSVKGLWETTT